MSYMLISRTEPVTAITDLCAQGHRGVTFCAATVTARGARLLVFTTKEQKCDSEYAQMTLLWGRHNVFVRNAQRAPGWHFSSWEATLAADVPLSSYSSFLLLLLLLFSARGGGRKWREEGREGNVMQKCAVQTEEAVLMPISFVFPGLNRHTHTQVCWSIVLVTLNQWISKRLFPYSFDSVILYKCSLMWFNGHIFSLTSGRGGRQPGTHPSLWLLPPPQYSEGKWIQDQTIIPVSASPSPWIILLVNSF